MTTRAGSALRPSERLTALVLGGLAGLSLLLRPHGWGLCTLALASLLLVVVRLAHLPASGRFQGIRDFAPVAVVLCVFLLLQPLITQANPQRWDAELAALDLRYFGRLASAWRGAFARPSWFTDLVYLVYASFYVLPLTVAFLIRRRHGAATFEPVAFTVLLGFYLSFLGYFLWPAQGPRVPQELEAAQLGGGALAQAVRAFLRGAETTTLDAFPSGHTALSVLPAILAARFLPRQAPLMWGWALSIVFATVYLGVHYVMDVIAGLLLAGLVLLLTAGRLRDHPPPTTTPHSRDRARRSRSRSHLYCPPREGCA